MIIADMTTVTLNLSPDNPCHTTITDSDTGKVVYTVATSHTDKKSVTEVKNAAGDILASAEWRDVRSDILMLGNTSPIPSSSWLRKSMVPFKDTVYFKDGEGRDFKWKGNGPGMALELYSQGDKSQPIARFLKSKPVMNHKSKPPTRDVTPATIVLDSRGAEIQDTIVISWCFLEKSRRAREASTMHRADAMATPLTGGSYALSNGGV